MTKRMPKQEIASLGPLSDAIRSTAAEQQAQREFMAALPTPKPDICIGPHIIGLLMQGQRVDLSNATLFPASDLLRHPADPEPDRLAPLTGALENVKSSIRQAAMLDAKPKPDLSVGPMILEPAQYVSQSLLDQLLHEGQLLVASCVSKKTTAADRAYHANKVRNLLDQMSHDRHNPTLLIKDGQIIRNP